MDARLDKLEDRLDKLADTLDVKLDRVLEIQTELQIDVAEHIRRTKIAEENIDKLAYAMQPVQEHVAFIRGFGKITGILLAAAAAVATIWQTFGGK